MATVRGSNTDNSLHDNMSETNPVLPDAPLDVREQLRQHFSVPYTQHNDRWHNLWEKGEFLPFDRGQPNPALIDTLTDRHTLVGKPVISHNGKTRKRALVPGCGRGYDVLLLAAFGYDAYGLEVSESAVKACNEFAEKEFAQYTTRGSEYGCGMVKFVLGDFFKNDWFEELRLPAGGFDLIYDYTVGRPYESRAHYMLMLLQFLCALPPARRPDWALRTSQLLNRSSEARLICVEFPTYKAPSTGGPPFGLTPDVYVSHLSRPGEHVPYTPQGYPEESSSSKEGIDGKSGLVRLDHWQPERTHAIGKGTDWVSVWTHK